MSMCKFIGCKLVTAEMVTWEECCRRLDLQVQLHHGCHGLHQGRHVHPGIHHHGHSPAVRSAESVLFFCPVIRTRTMLPMSSAPPGRVMEMPGRPLPET